MLDQRRVLASLAGQVFGEVGPSPQPTDPTTGSELRVVYLDFSSSPSGATAGQLPAGFVEGLTVAEQLLGGAFAGNGFAGGELVSGAGSEAYAVRGSFLNQIHLETGGVETLELPAPILSAQLLSDGRILATLDTTGSAAEAAGGVPAAVVVSFASGDWEPVAEAEWSGNVFAAAVAYGDRGVLIPAVRSSTETEGAAELQVAPWSVQVDSVSGELRVGEATSELAAETRVVASSSGPLAVVSEPAAPGRHVSLWSTRSNAPVAGSEQTLAEVGEVLLFDDASSLVIARHIDGGIQVLDGANRFAALHRLPEWTGPVALDARGEWLFGVREDQSLQVFDIREGRIRHTLPLGLAAAEIVGGLALADGGNRLLLSSSAGVTRMRVDRLDLRRSAVGGDSRIDSRTVDSLFDAYQGEDYASGLAASRAGFIQQGNIDPGDASVAENDFGALIAHLQVTGVDANKEVELRVEDERFVLDGIELRLAPDVAFDHELEPVVEVEIVLATVDTHETLATRTLVITVTDVNEAIIDIRLDRQEVPEKTPGCFVSTVRVIDPDSDDHTLSVDDSRFEIIDGTLKLRDGVFVRRADQEEILVTITASEISGSFSKEFVLTVTSNELPLHNPTGPTDVNGDGRTDPLDALIVINILNQGGPVLVGDLSLTGGDDTYFYDVNGDGVITPLDALIIINKINRQGTGQAEAPPSGQTGGAIAGGSSSPESGLSGEGESRSLEWAVGEEIVDSSTKSKALVAATATGRETNYCGPLPLDESVPLDESERGKDASRETLESYDDFFTGIGSNG
ncbi:dockerin type I domain-containing protein [Candidatus Laterigemmans baculatus]|uniref:dockerin type I domain-containing protein n=1 Tax=Candidatus Laterigemmans baculatus TaxID=2770505 RepID=UPI00193AE4F3|nr:dockerin type I domain-containing protein [Candidatus Laterigemmans baculatus]